AAALHFSTAKLAAARLGRKLAERARDLVDILAIGIANHRYQQAVGRIGREADVNVFLVDQVLAAGVERGVEQRKLLQRLDAGTHDERQRRQLDAGAVGFALQGSARFLQRSDVGFVK